MSMQEAFVIHTLELGPMDNFVYVIADNESKQAAVVDPAWEMDKLMAFLTDQGLHLTDILLTHTHHDHVNGVEILSERYQPHIHLSSIEAQFWGRHLNHCVLHEQDDQIALGNTQIQVHHTPGHTPGSVCYYLNNHLITGDTLFIFGCGRCDLPGGDPRQMFHTLKKIAKLPPETRIHPGHHYGPEASTTLAAQIKNNPFMQFDNEADFIRYRMPAKR